MQRFGAKVRMLREQRGLSVRQLTAALGMQSHSHIAKIETGQSQPSADMILRLARFFDVSIDALMKDELDLPPNDAAAQ